MASESVQESSHSPTPPSLGDEHVGITEQGEPRPSETIESDIAGINAAIMNNQQLVTASADSSAGFNIGSGSASPLPTTMLATNLSSILQLDIRDSSTRIGGEPGLGRHISEWNADEVQGWFQSYNLDELYGVLFDQNDSKDGLSLRRIFESKLKNYENYRIQYGRRFLNNKEKLLKDFDIFGQRLDAHFMDKYNHRFDVAFSFPGDIRDKVCRIAERLCTRMNREKIFYDKYHEVELARPNLDLYLLAVYRYQTRLIVVFMCDDYSRKEWCGLESRAIRSLLKSDQNSRIMLLSVDGKTIDGVLDIDGYLDISNKTDNEVADAIYNRIENLDKPLVISKSSYLGPLPLSLRSSTLNSFISKAFQTLKNNIQSISPWYFVIGLLSYILGTFMGR